MTFWKQIKYFKSNEFDSPSILKSGYDNMDEQFVRKLDALREKFGKPMIITSGYRTEIYNDRIGGAPNSMHVKGKAADILVRGEDAYTIIGLAYMVGLKGIGVSQKGRNRFIHLDDRDEPMVWSY